MQLLAALPNQKPVVATAASSPKKAPPSPAKSNNAPPSVSVAPRKSDPGPISYRNNNNAGSGVKRVYQPKIPTKSESQPDTTKSSAPNSVDKKLMVRGPVQREVVTNPQKSVSVKDLIGAASNTSKSPSKSGKDGWILPKTHSSQPAQPVNNNQTGSEVDVAQPTDVKSEPAPVQPAVQPEAPTPVATRQPAEVKPEPVHQPEPTQEPAPVHQPEQRTPVQAVPIQAIPIEVPPQEAKPEEPAHPDSPTKVETPRTMNVTSPPPEPKSDTQIAKDLDSKLLEVMNRRRMEQQQQQKQSTL